MKRLFSYSAMLMAIASIAIITMPGCGGGKSSVAPSVSAGKGNGTLAAKVVFSGKSGGRSLTQTTSGSVDVSVTVSGYYEEDGTAFDPVTAQGTINLAQGSGKISVLEVPIGRNHLMTAVAKWGSATETIKCVIPIVSEGETTTATADEASTVVADAAIEYAKKSNKKLSDLSDETISKLDSAVRELHIGGIEYYDMTPSSVVAYADAKDTLSGITITPSPASVAPGGQQQFTAVVTTSSGSSVSGASISWDLDPPALGTISSSGLFVAGTTVATGTVKAMYGSLAQTADVTIAFNCGDGTIDPGETCDDGTNNGQLDYCNANCSGATTFDCGDGIVDPGETCDEGASNGLPGHCDDVCSGITVPVCGNSVVETGETCDAGSAATNLCEYGLTSCEVCDQSCALVSGEVSYCSDGVIDSSAGEACDDGNAVDMDGCSALCAVETPTYVVGKYVRGNFCSPATAISSADVFTAMHTYETDGFGYATLTLVANSTGFATGPKEIPFHYTPGAYHENLTAGRYMAISSDGDVMFQLRTGITEDSGEPTRAMCIGVGVRAIDDTSAPMTTADVASTYIVMSIGSDSSSTWTAREEIVLDGAGNYTSTILSATYQSATQSVGTYSVSPDGSISVTDESGSYMTGMVKPDGNMFFLVNTDPLTAGGIFLSVGMKASSGSTGPVSSDSYTNYMLGIENIEGYYANATYGVLDIAPDGGVAFNAISSSSGTLDANADMVTFEPDGQFTTSESNFGVGSPDGEMFVIVDTDTLQDYYMNMSLGMYRSPAPSASCGDGLVEIGESCDDGNAVTETCVYGQYSCVICDANCSIVSGPGSYCGDAVIDSGDGETCDDGPNNGITCNATYGSSCSYCQYDCTSVSVTGSFCGDGVIDSGFGENCDDGNAIGGDGCSATCILE